MRSKRFFVWFLCVCLFADVDGSTCKPLSFFKVDCNICICDASGKQYTCEHKICQRVPDYNNFIKEFDKDGRLILIPKSSYQSKYDPEDDFAYKTKQARTKPSNREVPDVYDDLIKSFLV